MSDRRPDGGRARPRAVMAGTAAAAAVALAGWALPVAAASHSVVYAQHNLHVTSFAEHTRFWKGMLGAATMDSPDPEVAILSFPNLVIFMREIPPSGGTAGSAVDHVGFQVPRLRELVARLRAAGFPMIAAGAVPSSRRGPGDIGFSEDLQANVAFVLAPDALKVELIENAALERPVFHHVHLVTPQVEAARAWYGRVFGAVPADQGSVAADRLPLGVSLLFSPSLSPVVGTRGRVIDHIGFEVSDLKEFCAATEARGVRLDQGYRIVPAPWNSHSASLTDPVGTYIQVTEGAAFGFFRPFVDRD